MLDVVIWSLHVVWPEKLAMVLQKSRVFSPGNRIIFGMSDIIKHVGDKKKKITNTDITSSNFSRENACTMFTPGVF